MSSRAGVPASTGGLPQRAKTTIYSTHLAHHVESDSLSTRRLSPLQKNLLDLASASSGPVKHVVALQTLFGLQTVIGKRGGRVLDWTDARVRTARTTLHRALERLARRGLIQFCGAHSYRLTERNNP